MYTQLMQRRGPRRPLWVVRALVVTVLIASLPILSLGAQPCAAQSSKARTPSLQPDFVPLNSRMLPRYSSPLPAGRNQLMLKNPFHFKVVVQVRSGSRATQFSMEGKSTRVLRVPDGEFTCYYRFAEETRIRVGRSFVAENGLVQSDDEGDGDKKDTGRAGDFVFDKSKR